MSAENRPDSNPGINSIVGVHSRGSMEARAVAKGIKEQKWQESTRRTINVASFVAGVVLGLAMHSWAVFLLIWLGGMAFATWWYWKE